MSSRAELFLGIIAFTSLATAIVQIGVLVAAGLMFRRAKKLIDTVEVEMKPVFTSVQSIARDAARATTLAAAQVERVDRALTEAGRRIQSAVNTFDGIAGPLKGLGWISIFRAVFKLIRKFRGGRRRRARTEDEDALFI